MKTTLNLLLLFLLHTATIAAEPEATKDKITRDEAQHIALKQIPDGSVKSARLKSERGIMFWSVEIARPGTKELAKIHVDEKSGRIISQQPSAPAEGPKKPKP